MRTLFVDFDGTICFNRFWELLPPEQYQKIQSEWFPQQQTRIVDWMRGVYTAETINQAVAAYLHVPYETVWERFVTGCRQFHVEPDTLKAIDSLRNTFHVTLITGNMDCFDRFTLPALGLERYFDEIVNSYNEKALKTDNNGETFKKYCKGHISDAILVEDSVQSCLVFGKLGGTALPVTRETPTTMQLATLQGAQAGL